MPQIDIEIKELRRLTEAVLDFIEEETEGNPIPLDADYYWNIVEKEKLYNPYEKPELTLGQLYDDREWLKDGIEDKEHTIPFHVQCLSHILRYISHKPEDPNWVSSPGKPSFT